MQQSRVRSYDLMYGLSNILGALVVFLYFVLELSHILLQSRQVTSLFAQLAAYIPLSLLAHESSHYLVGKVLGLQPKIMIGGGGLTGRFIYVKIGKEIEDQTDLIKLITSSLAGPLLNLSLFVAGAIVITSNYSSISHPLAIFATANLFTFLSTVLVKGYSSDYNAVILPLLAMRGTFIPKSIVLKKEKMDSMFYNILVIFLVILPVISGIGDPLTSIAILLGFIAGTVMYSSLASLIYGLVKMNAVSRGVNS